MMVGRDVDFVVHKDEAKPKEIVLSAEGVCVESKLHKHLAVKNVSFNVRAGEIVCIAGIDGNGQSELVYALTGLIAGGSRVEHPVRFVAKRLFSSLPFDTYLLIIVLSVAGVRLPSELVAFTEPIANANSFLAMFMLGLMMSFSISHERMAKVARLVGLRAAFSVLLTCVIWLALPIDQTMRALLTLLVWSPASALAPMYTQMSGGDGGLAGFANALTIILGVIAATFIALTLV